MNAYESAGPTELAEAEPSAPVHAARRTASGLLGASAGLGSTFWGWAGPALIMLFGGFIRFYRLSKPNAVVFDETYYVPDSNSILRHGVELITSRTSTRCCCTATRTSCSRPARSSPTRRLARS